jgi:hypothetical protein
MWPFFYRLKSSTLVAGVGFEPTTFRLWVYLTN